MKKNIDKWVFLGITVILLIGFFIVCNTANGIDERNQRISDVKKPNLSNPSISLKMTEDGTLYINGNGELTAEDLTVLMSSQKIRASDIEHIILADNITEVGYKCINGYLYLNSIKIGKNCKRISNGAICNCPRIKYVFLYEDTKRVGLDFLAGSSDVVLVCDGLFDESLGLEEKEEVTKCVVNTKSFSELCDSVSQGEMIIHQTADMLVATDYVEHRSGGDTLRVNAGELQYGPHIILARGEYFIEIKGNNLGKLTDDSFSVSTDLSSGGFDDFQIDEHKATFHLKVHSNNSEYVFCVNNNIDNAIEIECIDVYELIIVPDYIQQWWD